MLDWNSKVLSVVMLLSAVVVPAVVVFVAVVIALFVALPSFVCGIDPFVAALLVVLF